MRDMAAFNAKWDRRQRLFRRYESPPPWTPGVAVTQEMRVRYEIHMPVHEYLHDLGKLLTGFVPHPSWLPFVLRTVRNDVPARSLPEPLSIPDVWSQLPPWLAGRLSLRHGELLPLACALADSKRFGSGFGRYPAQMDVIKQWAAARYGRMLSVLDMGCGTGEGTWEMASAIARSAGCSTRAVGMTREPLEAWMAASRCIPHWPERGLRYQAFRPGSQPVFLAADATVAPLNMAFDLIVINGLAGGPAFNADAQYCRLLDALERCSHRETRLLLANRFHDGCRPRIERFRNAAEQRRWWTKGTRDCLICGWCR